MWYYDLRDGTRACRPNLFFAKPGMAVLTVDVLWGGGITIIISKYNSGIFQIR